MGDTVAMLPTSETMTAEFKSEKTLSDSDIVLAAVCLANAEGGRLYLGIENDGRVTGASMKRQDTHRVAALIANSTSPSLSVRVTVQDAGKYRVTIIEVPQSRQLLGTTDGCFLRRVLKGDGTGMSGHARA